MKDRSIHLSDRPQVAAGKLSRLNGRRMTGRNPLRQIVVMGGGGFSMEPRNPRLDRYILNLAGKSKPRVCFVGTASGDSRDYVRRFYLAMEKLPCRPSDVSLFRLDTDPRPPIPRLLEQDVIYVGGGNTANLLAVWRLHGVDKAMRQAWRRGIILCGISAGMICWFESSVTDSFGPHRELLDGVGLLPGSACPHYDGEPNRRPTYQRLVRAGVLPGGVAADDGAAIHFVGRKILRCVSSRPKARTYRVERNGKKVLETPLPTIFLRRNGKF
jgi:peptidase E